MDNIALFNQIAASLLKLLYEKFPRAIMLNTSSLRTEFGISDEDWWDSRVGANPIGATLRWLYDEGFVRYTDNAGGQSFANVVLTSKGLTALNRSPDSLTPKPTIGDRLKELGTAATKEAIATLIKAALSGGG